YTRSYTTLFRSYWRDAKCGNTIRNHWILTVFNNGSNTNIFRKNFRQIITDHKENKGQSTRQKPITERRRVLLNPSIQRFEKQTDGHQSEAPPYQCLVEGGHPSLLPF